MSETKAGGVRDEQRARQNMSLKCVDLREAAKKVLFLVAWPLRGGGGGEGVRAGLLKKALF